MAYFPVGASATYTASVDGSISAGFGGITQSMDKFLAWLKDDLQNQLPGDEEFDVLSSSGSASFLSPSSFSIVFLNNGVDHGDENDARAIIDGEIFQRVKVLSSSITSVSQPGDPPIATGAPTNQPGSTIDPRTGQTVAPSNSFDLSKIIPNLTPGLGTGVVIVLIAIVALVLLLPGGFVQASKAFRGRR